MMIEGLDGKVRTAVLDECSGAALGSFGIAGGL